MVILVAHYRTQPGMGPAVAAALRDMEAAVAANEPGCLRYHAACAVDDPEVFVLSEAYADATALAAHRESAHFRAIIQVRVVPLLRERVVREYIPVRRRFFHIATP
jgi:autoinducer 2-degrading protein